LEPTAEQLPAATVRSRLMLEAAADMVSDYAGWPQKQALIQLREQGGESWGVTLFASDAPGSIDEVASVRVQIGIVNPSAILAMAVRGTGPFPQPLPLQVITVIPQFDQFGFAVTDKVGVRTLREVVQNRTPLRLSLRGQRDHSVHMLVSQVLEVIGASVEDFERWGGLVRYDPELPAGASRMGAAERGEIDAIFDEAMPSYGNRALEHGMRFLALDEEHLQALEAKGLRRVAITREEYPLLGEDVWTVDFSGWPVFVREDLPDRIVTRFCQALEARKDRIPWYGNGPLPLETMCKDTREGHLPVPLHPAAERFWRDRGYLS
jgi:TRAP-type uncharacterized transport system substrate-binding protein